MDIFNVVVGIITIIGFILVVLQLLNVLNIRKLKNKAICNLCKHIRNNNKRMDRVISKKFFDFEFDACFEPIANSISGHKKRGIRYFIAIRVYRTVKDYSTLGNKYYNATLESLEEIIESIKLENPTAI